MNIILAQYNKTAKNETRSDDFFTLKRSITGSRNSDQLKSAEKALELFKGSEAEAFRLRQLFNERAEQLELTWLNFPLESSK